MSSGEIISREQLTQMETQDPTVAKQIEWLHTWGDWYGSADPSIRPMVAEEARNNIVFYQWAGMDGSVHYKAAWKFDQGYPGFILVPPAINWQELNPPVASPAGHEIGPGQGPVMISLQCTEGSDLAKMGVPVGAQLIPEAGTGDWVMVSADTVVARVDAKGVWERVSNRPDGLATVPEGYSAVRNPDGTWGYGVGTGADVTPVPDLTVDASGAHFMLDGVRMDIPASAIKDRIQVGQSGALQIYNEQKTTIDYAWDTETKVWIKASDVISQPTENVNQLVKVSTWKDLDELSKKVEMFLTPFPEDTYFPPLDQVIINYDDSHTNMDRSKRFNFYYPFGNDMDPIKSPFNPCNYVVLSKGERRTADVVIVFQQVFNPLDKSFSVMKFGFAGEILASAKYHTQPGRYLLPDYSIVGGLRGDLSVWHHLAETGYLNPNGSMPKIEEMVKKWLTEGVVPEEMENIVFLPDWEPHVP